MLKKARGLVFSAFSFALKTNPCSQVLEFKLVLLPGDRLFSSALPSYT